MAKIRADQLLFASGKFPSRERARAAVMAGDVFVGDTRVDKPGEMFAGDTVFVVREQSAFVSRGGLKLEKALNAFGLDVTGFVCVDAGASTGGFTDCLLKRGAKHVTAADVGYGQLDWGLRNDPRVTVLERVNARYLELDFAPDLVTADLSFISVKLLLPVFKKWGAERVIALIKPQFEAGRGAVGKNGVVRDPETHRRVLREVAESARDAGFFVSGLTFSPIRGPKGNIEFLMYLTVFDTAEVTDIGAVVETANRDTAG